jgi:putative ABC transport system permease protein
VLPAGFRFHPDVDLWRQTAPASEAPFIHERAPGSSRSPIARLRPGVTIAQAQSEMDAIARQLAIEHPRENAGRGIRVLSLSDHFAGTAATPIRILYGAVCLVLLIACANVSGLLLARLRAREREIGLRLALGATRARLARQFMAEGVLLALPGAAAGLLLAAWMVRTIVLLAPADLSRQEEIAVNIPVALCTVVVSVACALVFGLVPIVQAGRVRPAAALGQPRTTAPGSDRFRVSLIVAQLALALVLLVGAGLLVRTYGRLASVDLGFTADNVVTIDVATQAPRFFEDWKRVVAFHDEALSQVGGVPGVRSAAVTSLIPLHEREGRFTETVARVDDPEDQRTAEYRFVSAGYFETLRIPLLRGREFLPTDRLGGERVAVLGASTAKALFGDADPMGREILLRGKTGRRVVGVVPDIRLYGPGIAAPLQVYGPYPQADDVFWTGLRFVLRTDGNPGTVGAAARQRLLAIDRSLPPFNVQPLDDLVSQSLAPARMYGALFVAFALLALVLACVGLYGLIAFLVTQRTREFGIRLALGASAADVRSLVARETAKVVGLALITGGALALAGGRLLEALLFGVSSTDWVTFGGGALLLMAVAAAASYAPARRAMRVDPILALRTE